MTLQEHIDEARQTLDGLSRLSGEIDAISRLLGDALSRGNTVLACGNGGSAAEAQHFVTELVGRYRVNRRPLPALFLGGDASQMTCISNDYEWNDVFARPLQAFARPGDVLLCLSTSGTSSNIVSVLKAARERDVSSIALLGKDGGDAAGLATHPLVISSNSTARIQEAHLFVIHWICEYLDKLFAT